MTFEGSSSSQPEPPSQNDTDAGGVPAFVRRLYGRPRVYENRAIRNKQEQIDAMGRKMETGVVSEEKHASSAAQREKLMSSLPSKDPWQRTDEPEALPDGWTLEAMGGRMMYRNTHTGLTSTSKPRAEAVEEETPESLAASFRSMQEGEAEWGGWSVYPEEEAVLTQAQQSHTPSLAARVETEEEEEAAGAEEEEEEEFVAGWTGNVEAFPDQDAYSAARWEDSEDALLATLLLHPAPQCLDEDSQASKAEFRRCAGGEGRTRTLRRAQHALFAADHAALAPLAQAPEEEGAEAPPLPDALKQQLSSGAVASPSSQVPAHLAPGHNAGQLNWAERQLADAQQKHRPRGDLPGFAAAKLTQEEQAEQEEEEEEEEVRDDPSVEIIPLWNPIPFANPKKVRVGIRRDLYAQQPPPQNADPSPPPAPKPKSFLEDDDGVVAGLQASLFAETAELLASATRGLQHDLTPSSLLVPLSPDTGAPKLRGQDLSREERAFVFVDEHTCIGCTNCAMIARNTFKMEEDHGRARVFLQAGDAEEIIGEAVDSCPVDCIHPLSFQELQVVEEYRKGDTVNNKARLVGGSYTSDDKGGTPWLRLLAWRSEHGKPTGNIFGF